MYMCIIMIVFSNGFDEFWLSRDNLVFDSRFLRIVFYSAIEKNSKFYKH